MSDVRIVSAGDAMLVAEFDDRIDPSVNARVVALASTLRDHPPRGVRDVVPTFRSVAVYFDPLVTDVEQLTARLTAEPEVQPAAAAAAARSPVDIPVCYASEFAPDLDDVARFAGISSGEVAAIHRASDYRVYMLGFVPGFAYLGLVDARIAAPRRSEPRVTVPAGSVAIAGRQTGIYPRQTPGGWNIVGRTPVPMIAMDHDPPTRLQPGETVRFRAITRAEFDVLASAMAT
jgi:inhibitor of KinA